MRLFLKAGIIIISILSLAGGVGRAEIASMNVIPSVNEIVLSENETKSGIYTVQNSSEMDMRVTIVSSYWYLSEENKDIPLSSWLTISPTEFDLPAGENRDIPYEVTAPKGALGELVAKLSFCPKPIEGEVAVNVVFSVSLYLKIRGTGKPRHELDDFKIWKHKDKEAMGIEAVLKNKGNIHLRPRTTVYVQDFLGEALKRVPLKYGVPVYPDRTQNYRGNIFNFSLKPGLYRAVVETRYTDTTGIFTKRIYFFVGKGGRVWFTSFRRPKR